MPEADGWVLVVRHGQGRGRMPDNHARLFARVARRFPETWNRVRLHVTGTPAPALEGARAVLFLLGDPLRELYPACYEEACAVAARARTLGIRVLNPPEALSSTVKSAQARAWADAGIPTPPAVRVESRDELAARARELGYPLIVRGDQCHAQLGMRVLTGARDLAALPSHALPLPAAVGPLEDVRWVDHGHRASAPYAWYYHKRRLLVLGDRIRTKHVLFATQPIVSAKTSIFHRTGRLAWLRPALRACVREDMAYWRRGEEHGALMRRALAVLGIDVAAVDYSTRADGSVVLWEANPYPYLPEEHDIALPSWRCAPERIRSYDEAIARFLGHLAGATS